MHRAIRRHVARFGHEPEAVATAPGRVNLLGEHVDHRGGVVLPFAIERRVAVAVGVAPDGRTTVVADDLDLEASWPEAPPGTPTDDPDRRFANHVLGMLASLPGISGEMPPLAITVAGDLPMGAGLSSSAAVAVATGLAASALVGHPLPTARSLAIAARRSEHTFVGTPCGLMDPLASAAGRADQVLRIDCHAISWDHVSGPDPARTRMLLLDSGGRHDLADGGYADRLAALDRVERILGRALRTIDEPELSAADLDPIDRRRARHVVREMARVEAAIPALQRNDAESLGTLLLESHASLRDDFEVSTPELDTLVEAVSASRPHGAFGARMIGGGFGGAVLMLATRDRADEIATSVSNTFETAFGRRPAVLEVSPSAGGRLESADGGEPSYPRTTSDAAP